MVEDLLESSNLKEKRYVRITLIWMLGKYIFLVLKVVGTS
jgi:hypothetical protein